MPNMEFIHPQVVHFVIALAFVGVGARLVSLLPLGDRFRFTTPMATVLIVLAAIAAVLAQQSGTDAHGPVERVPGAREAVQEHEDAGKLARNVLLGLAALELVTLALAGSEKLGKGLRVVAALGGLGALYTVYEAGDEGGKLVYNYAGGIGLRSRDTADVRHLLVAGLYHNAMQARVAGRGAEAARLIGELRRQMPDDPNVHFMGVESMVRDEGRGRDALTELATITVSTSDVRSDQRKAMLMADAYVALGARDSARLTLKALQQKYPDNTRVHDAVDRALHRLDSLPPAPVLAAPAPTPIKRD